MVARATKLIGTPTVIGKGDTLPVPTVKLEGVESLSGHSCDLELYTAAGAVKVVTGVVSGSSFQFPIGSPDTDTPVFWRSYVKITNVDGSYTLPGFLVAVVDFAALWATPAEVADIADEEFTVPELVFGILAAEEAVRAWVAKPITSPVSERVRRAVALLAARALTTSSEGSIISEMMGDYQVRYSSPQPSGLIIDGEVERLLGPWSKGEAYSVYIGPDDQSTSFFSSDLYSEA